MKRKTIGLVITPHGTIERHNLDIESTVMWGETDRNMGRPAWLTPNSLRNTKKKSFVLLRSTTIVPFSVDGEDLIVDRGIKTRQAMTEQYHKQTSAAATKDSFIVLIGLLTVLILATITFLGVSAPFVIQQLRSQNESITQENQSPIEGSYFKHNEQWQGQDLVA